jgi:hypothetical protein
VIVGRRANHLTDDRLSGGAGRRVAPDQDVGRLVQLASVARRDDDLGVDTQLGEKPSGEIVRRRRVDLAYVMQRVANSDGRSI